MSWSIIAVGKGSHVKEQFAKKIETIKAQSYTPDVERSILDAHAAAVNAQCDAAGEKSVIAESNGHADSSGNSSGILNVRSVYDS